MPYLLVWLFAAIWVGRVSLLLVFYDYQKHELECTRSNIDTRGTDLSRIWLLSDNSMTMVGQQMLNCSDP